MQRSAGSPEQGAPRQPGQARIERMELVRAADGVMPRPKSAGRRRTALRDDASGLDEGRNTLLHRLSRIGLEAKYTPRLLLFLVLVSLAIRLSAVFLLVENSSDGPARASIAYNWAHSHEIDTHGNDVHITYGIWPPGFTYLSGLFAVLIDSPMYSTRI